jgi:hypothetical protein
MISFLDGMNAGIEPVFIKDEICSKYRTTGDLLSATESVVSFENEQKNLIKAELDKFLRAASPSGQKIVMDYIDLNVTPLIRHQEVDEIYMFIDNQNDASFRELKEAQLNFSCEKTRLDSRYGTKGRNKQFTEKNGVIVETIKVHHNYHDNSMEK